MVRAAVVRVVRIILSTGTGGHTASQSPSWGGDRLLLHVGIIGEWFSREASVTVDGDQLQLLLLRGRSGSSGYLQQLPAALKRGKQCPPLW